jgi:hypothetical protein
MSTTIIVGQERLLQRVNPDALEARGRRIEDVNRALAKDDLPPYEEPQAGDWQPLP